jgi:hypothetical protein
MVDRLRVTELDFDTIKNNLKLFLNQQSEFTDYDFEGSGLSTLLDILAYNTHYNAYYLNMVANEAFLDTALLRDSVVSHAKTLGYTPYSQRAPVAIINFTAQATNNNPSTLTIPAGYSFISNQIDNTTYNFVVLEDTIATKANSQYVFENLEIYEGQLITYNFVHDQSTNPKQVFTLPDTNIDTTTIKVGISPSTSNTQFTVYNRVTDIVDASTTSEIYFLQESRGSKFQIYFGNDTIGKSLPDGAVVSISYLVTNGTAANKANNFIAAAPLVDFISDSISNFTIEPISAAAGGADRESIDQIKYSSAAQFTTQNRLVTFKDYESYIKQNYPAVESLSVWGGEDNDPPIFGKVFISLKPRENYFISEAEKQRIIDTIIKPKAIVSTDVEILEPEFLFLLIEPKVLYDARKTTLSENNLRTNIQNAILSYRDVNLNQFDSKFSLSKLIEQIDAVDLNAIVGTKLPRVRVQKRFKPTLNQRAIYTIRFNVPLNRGISPERFLSSQFRVLDSFGVERTVGLEEIPNSFTGISNIEVTNPGTGYLTEPTVTITGDGIGATARAIVVNGRIKEIQVTNRGINYTRAVATISGGNGFGAVATVVIDTRIGVLRTIFYDSNAQRQVVNANAGEIDYDAGIITLKEVNIRSVLTTDGFIRLNFRAEESIIESSRNTIITIDDTDPASIIPTLEKI